MSIFMDGQQHHQNKLPSVPRKPKQRESFLILLRLLGTLSVHFDTKFPCSCDLSAIRCIMSAALANEFYQNQVLNLLLATVF